MKSPREEGGWVSGTVGKSWTIEEPRPKLRQLEFATRESGATEITIDIYDKVKTVAKSDRTQNGPWKCTEGKGVGK